MRITESYLRRVIREELLKEKKYAKINEWEMPSQDTIAAALPVVGAAAIGVVGGISLLKRAIKNRAVRKLTFDFIRKSKNWFDIDIAGSTWASLASSISLKDITDWVNQDGRLSSKTMRGSRANVYSTLLGEKSLATFNPSSARKIFINDKSFRFDSEDIKYLDKIYSVIHRNERFNNGGNTKFQLIDTLFYIMVTLYNYKYSSEATDSRLDAEREFSKILGVKITLNGKNTWESDIEYKRSLDIMSWRGPSRKFIRIPEGIAKNLSEEKIVQIADTHVKYADNLVTRLYLPYDSNIKIYDIESDIRSLKNKFDFLSKVIGVCFTFAAPGAASLELFLKELAEAVAKDQSASVIIDKLVKRIEDSGLENRTLKEVLKLITNIILNVVV